MTMWGNFLWISTVEEANEMFTQYYMNYSASRSIDAEVSSIPLDPGMVTPAWEEAVLTSNEVNSYVNIPIQTAWKHYVKSPYNESWVEAPQKLVAVQDDMSQRRNLYVMTVVPEGIFAYKQANAFIYHCHGAKIPNKFSGLIIYTKPQGGIPIYMAHYNNGSLKQDVFLFDKANTYQENVDKINSMLTGYHEQSVRRKTASLSRSESWIPGGNLPSGIDYGEWFYHPEGDPYTAFYEDGSSYTYWYTDDGKGNNYIVGDMDGDGIPDTILDMREAPVTGGGGGSLTIGTGGGIGGNWGGEGSSPGGDVNPGDGDFESGDGDDDPIVAVCPYNTPGCPGGIFCRCCHICQGRCKSIPCLYCGELHCARIHIDCGEGDYTGNQTTTNLYKIFSNTQKDDIRTRPGFQDFLDAIKNDPTIEHSVSLNYYEDEDVYRLTDINHGGALRVMTGAFPNTTVAYIHNHPNMVPPSADDIFCLAWHALNENSNVTTSFVYCGGDIYALYVVDKEKLRTFYDKHKNSVDSTTNNFLPTSELGMLYEAYKNRIQKTANEDEAKAFALADLLKNKDSGMRLLSKSSKENEFANLKTRSFGELLFLILCS